MAQRVIEEKLESLRRCISRIEQKRPSEIAALEEDIDLQDIISVNLERAIQLCVDIGTHIIANSEKKAPSSMAETFLLLEGLNILSGETATVMRKAVGFRNIAVHNYKKIDWEIVFNICTKQLADFKHFAREINAYITDSQ